MNSGENPIYPSFQIFHRTVRSASEFVRSSVILSHPETLQKYSKPNKNRRLNEVEGTPIAFFKNGAMKSIRPSFVLMKFIQYVEQLFITRFSEDRNPRKMRLTERFETVEKKSLLFFGNTNDTKEIK